MNGSILNAETNMSEVFHPLTLDNSSSRGLRLDYRSLTISATMFAVGVLGNLVAVVVLCISKKEQKETTFYTLVCGMAITDLLGTCFTSPVVIATYIVGKWPGGALLCHLFSFSMLFFGSAGMSILCTMSVERYLAINHAYFYSKHVDRTMARFALLVAYFANVVLCAMPSFGFGKHVKHFPGTWCFLDWRALDALGASYSFLYAGFMLLLIAVTVVCNFAVCRSLVSMSKKTRVIRAETSGHGGSRRVFSKLPSVTSAAEIQMFWLLIFMTIVFLICSIPLVVSMLFWTIPRCSFMYSNPDVDRLLSMYSPQVRIFVNQIYGPSYIAAGGQPDYRSDLLAIRFASFNPILDPWVYILCRKNLFTKGCERIKRTVGMSGSRRSRPSAWAGQHSPPSFGHSNDTSYVSLRTTTCRNATGKKQTTTNTKSYVDLTLRQTWDFDNTLDNFHPFSVEQNPVSGIEGEVASSSETIPAKSAGCVPALPSSSARHAAEKVVSRDNHQTKAETVTCTFSTPSSCLSEKCV